MLSWNTPTVFLIAKYSVKEKLGFKQKSIVVIPPKELRTNNFWVGHRVYLGPSSFMAIVTHQIVISKVSTKSVASALSIWNWRNGECIHTEYLDFEILNDIVMDEKKSTVYSIINNLNTNDLRAWNFNWKV